MTTPTPLSFEAAYARLEEILSQVHSGKVSLEDSLKLYEEANHLMQSCQTRLQEAEQRIEILTKNRDGGVQIQPFTRTPQS